MESPAIALQPHVSFDTSVIGNKWKDLMHEQVATLCEDLDAFFDAGTDEYNDALIEAGIKWDMEHKDSRIELFVKRYFWKEIQRITGVDLDYIFDYLEKFQEKQRKEEQHSRLLDGLQQGVNSLMSSKDIQGTLQALTKTVINTENIIADRPTQPIVSLGADLDGLRTSLKSTQGVEFIGLTQNVIPRLDKATGGFGGLNLITAKSNEGKTAFVIQNVLEIMTTRSDVCCLFVSLDMLRPRVNLRCLVNRARIPIRVARSGSTPEGWTPQERLAVEKGFTALEKLGNRFRVLDRFNFPHATRHSINREMRHLMDESECENIILVIDFLELMVPPVEEKNPDDWLIEQVRWIADNMNDQSVVFCICESGKGDSYARGSAANVKGSYRKVMRSDCVITLSVMTDEEITDFYEINDHDFYNRRPDKDPPSFKNDKEMLKVSKRIKKLLKHDGLAPIMLKIDKARDGAERDEFYIQSHWRQNYFTPLERFE